MASTPYNLEDPPPLVTPWRCQRGFHSDGYIRWTDPADRYADYPAGTLLVACRRCKRYDTRQMTHKPRRWRSY